MQQYQSLAWCLAAVDSANRRDKAEYFVALDHGAQFPSHSELSTLTLDDNTIGIIDIGSN